MRLDQVFCGQQSFDLLILHYVCIKVKTIKKPSKKECIQHSPGNLQPKSIQTLTRTGIYLVDCGELVSRRGRGIKRAGRGGYIPAV